jgi:KDO2-lipid IV(A) lauroyltransferase
MNFRDIRWAAAVSAVMIVTVPFVLLPLRPAVWLGGKLGLCLYMILGKWRKVGFESLNASLPYLRSQKEWDQGLSSPDQIARSLFVNIGKLVAELSRLYHGLDRSLLDTVEFRGMEHYRQAKARGNGILFITAHSGNWELLALSFGARFDPVAVVARPMKKQYIDKILEKMRSHHGNRVIYRDQAVREILTELKGNGNVGILVDQVAPPQHGIVVDFLGRPAWTTRIPVKLAMKSQAALLPIFIHREKWRNIITIHPEVKLEDVSRTDAVRTYTSRLNHYIEQHIIRYPDQWNWLYRRWKGTKGLSLAEQGKN